MVQDKIFSQSWYTKGFVLMRRELSQNGRPSAWLGLLCVFLALHCQSLINQTGGWLGQMGRAWVPHGKDAESPIINATHRDSVGTSQIVAWKDGRIEFELFGFGTAEATQNLLNNCTTAMAQIDPHIKCTVLVDMRNGIGCSPLAIPCIIRFVRKKSYRLQHVAVIGPRPLMSIVRMICKRTKLAGVAFFSDRVDAQKWCAEELQT